MVFARTQRLYPSTLSVLRVFAIGAIQFREPVMGVFP